MEIPSRAIRSAYGLRRTFALPKFTSGISRSEARDGSRCFLPLTFFIALPLMRCGAPCADDAGRILGFLDEDHEQNASLVRLTDKNRSLGVQRVLDHRRERVGEHRDGLQEGDPAFLQVRRGLLEVPREPHMLSVTHFFGRPARTPRSVAFGQRVVRNAKPGPGSEVPPQRQVVESTRGLPNNSDTGCKLATFGPLPEPETRRPYS